jgi:GNAT superfamily N-acetyltransferase
MEIRRYRPGDGEAVRSLHFEALEAVGARMDDEERDRDLDDIEGGYLCCGGEFLVGEVDGEIVAMGALRRVDGDGAELKRMRVRPDHWRRGFGQAVLDALVRRTEDLGRRRLYLDTTVGQTAARRLYERRTVSGRRDADGGGFDVVFYERRLEAPGAR